MRKTGTFDIRTYMETGKREIEAALDDYLPPETAYPESLHKSIRYSVFSGGKRFRPILCRSCFGVCGGEGPSIMPVACAIELVHTYSLIHDDLPCMDDDDIRRGKPTNHKVFGEAVAVLAGDALLTLAVDLVVSEGAKAMGAERTIGVLEHLLHAIGSEGMVAGQVVDMESEGGGAGAGTVEYIHLHKTAALIEASCRCGAVVAGAGEAVQARISEYGRKLGLAFQITDDILDAEGGFGDLKAGASLDKRKEKATYPGVFGLERSREMAAALIEEAKDSVAVMGPGALPLLSMADLVIRRSS
jgi:geranylgeranyl diphosphate synthase type II